MERSNLASPWTPIRRGAVSQPRPRPPAAKPRVVSIPVHFVGSEKEAKTAKKPAAAAARLPAEVDRVEAAVKVQKVFRGFLVRKNVRVVRRVAAEVDEIEMKIRAEEEVIRSDGKERLRVSEMLMALLLRLDSVRGVRDYRKKVIRRVISLQEAVDSIAAKRDEREAGVGGNGAPAETLEEHRTDEEEAVRQECGDGISEVRDHTSAEGDFETLKSTDVQKEEAEEDDSVVVSIKETLEAKEEAPENVRDPMEEKILGNSSKCRAPLGTEGKTDEEDTTPNPVEEEETCADPSEGSAVVDQMPQGPGVKEVMERMIEENERLKRLVAELCERSAQQCRLIGGLAGRVERLEKKMEEKRMKKKSKSR